MDGREGQRQQRRAVARAQRQAPGPVAPRLMNRRCTLIRRTLDRRGQQQLEDRWHARKLEQADFQPAPAVLAHEQRQTQRQIDHGAAQGQMQQAEDKLRPEKGRSHA